VFLSSISADAQFRHHRAVEAPHPILFYRASCRTCVHCNEDDIYPILSYPISASMLSHTLSLQRRPHPSCKRSRVRLGCTLSITMSRVLTAERFGWAPRGEGDAEAEAEAAKLRGDLDAAFGDLRQLRAEEKSVAEAEAAAQARLTNLETEAAMLEGLAVGLAQREASHCINGAGSCVCPPQVHSVQLVAQSGARSHATETSLCCSVFLSLWMQVLVRSVPFAN
jgi:hypothetical protein